MNEKTNDHIGNRTRNLPAYRAVPQITAREHIPIDPMNQGLTLALAVIENFE